MSVVASQIALWVVVLTNLMLTLAIIRRMNSGPVPTPQGLQAGESAPTFSAETLTGRTVTLADFQRRTAFVFLAPGCPPCVESLPEYVRLAHLAKSSTTDLVVVSEGDAASTRQLVHDAGIQTDVVVAPRPANTFFDDYKVPRTPHFMVVENKQVVMAGAPYPSNRDWKALVALWEQSTGLASASKRHASV